MGTADDVSIGSAETQSHNESLCEGKVRGMRLRRPKGINDQHRYVMSSGPLEMTGPAGRDGETGEVTDRLVFRHSSRSFLSPARIDWSGEYWLPFG